MNKLRLSVLVSFLFIKKEYNLFEQEGLGGLQPPSFSLLQRACKGGYLSPFSLLNRPLLNRFLVFGTLMGHFLISFLLFVNFKIVFWIRILLLGGFHLIKNLNLRPPFIYFWSFWNLGGHFSLFFGFWKFRNHTLNQNSYFWRICYYENFDLRPPYIYFFLTLGCLFWFNYWLLKIFKLYL